MTRALFVLLAAAFSMAASAAQSGVTRTAAAAPVASDVTTATPVRGASLPLGRFFFSPAERAQLDVARLQRKAPTSAEPEVAEAPPPPQMVTYGGLVRRSDGRKMLWLNNRLVEEKEALAGLNVKGKVRPDGAVTLQAQSGATVDVKVGQTVELYTGKVAETRKTPPEEAAKPPADAKAAPDDGKPASAETKAPAAEPRPGVAAARPADADTPEKKPPPGGMGLKMDLGGRALSSEEAERISRSGK